MLLRSRLARCTRWASRGARRRHAAMRADRLLLLYPRAWRERYGDEFLAIIGERHVRLPQIIDIVSGAIDAHLSSDVRAITSRRHVTQLQGGTAVMEALKQSCIYDRQAIISKRDAWTGAGVVVGGSILMSVLGIGLDRAGFETLRRSRQVGRAFRSRCCCPCRSPSSRAGPGRHRACSSASRSPSSGCSHISRRGCKTRSTTGCTTIASIRRYDRVRRVRRVQ